MIIYCVNISQSTGVNYEWEHEINEIKNLMPDKIFCFCLEEYQPLLIFDKFFKNINPWLRANDQYITCFVPSAMNLTFDRVVFEGTVGYYTNTQQTVLNSLKAISTKRKFSNSFIDHTISTVYRNSKLFTCYNDASKWERALIVDQIAKHNLIEEGIVTFWYPNCVEQDGKIYKWQYYDGNLRTDLDDTPEHERTADHLPPNYLYGFCDIVTESTCEKNNFFITEKTVRSIACLKPFLVLSCKGFHKTYLRDKFGFQLYDEVFDYSFDDCDDVNDRISGIIKNLLSLKTLVEDVGKRKILIDLNKKILYNQSQLICNFYNKDLIVPESLKFMLHKNNYNLYYNNINGPWTIPLIDHMLNMGWIDFNNVYKRLT